MRTMKFAVAAALTGAFATAAVAAPAPRNPPARPADGAQLAAPASKDPVVQRGYKLYVDTGCYQCHGFQGSGGGAGPAIAAPIFPKPAFLHQIREPRQRMPFYTAQTLPDTDVDAIYAYLQTIQRGKPASEIPLIAKMP